MKKNTFFLWSLLQQQAFNTLKSKFTTKPVFAFWHSDWDTRVQVDASEYATGGEISQLDPNNFLWHFLAFHSQTMSATECNYKIYDRKLMAIIEALQDWQHFFKGLLKSFKIITDHVNL